MTTKDGESTAADSALGHANTLAGPGGEAQRASLARYQGSTLLGRGGMGEVMRATDLEIGREIAIKRMRHPDADPAHVERFLREARIQARLEHPAIVPVYELGHDTEGKPYFTMKKIGGTTLAQLLASTEPPEAIRRRALRALVDVALAIDFAHRRGIVHRDLKPANVMLGEFGEVHVLDWGVARVLVEDAPTDHTIDPDGALPTEVDRTGASHREAARSGEARPRNPATRAGDIVGTRGYMAPEQARGDEVDRPADVYALGAVLFEVLTGAPLHPRDETALTSTLDGVTRGPRARFPDLEISPELDALCLATLATAPQARPSARAFADRLQDYLDGDRDVQRRRQLAAEHLAAARIAWGDHAGDELAARARALREVGRALALDPALAEAADLASELRTRPTPQQPAEVARVIAEIDRTASRKQATIAAITLSLHLPFALVAIALGVDDWKWFGAYLVCSALLIASAARDAVAGTALSAWTTVVMCALQNAIAVRMFGPFVIVPSVAAASTLSLLAFPPLRKHPFLVTTVILGGWLAPIALEAAGLLSSSFEIANGTITSHSILALDGVTGTALVLIVNTAVLVATAQFLHRLAGERRAAQIGLALEAWHDRQMSPAK